MGIAILIPDAVFTNPLASVSLPFLNGLVAEWWMGNTEAETIINRANAAGPPMIPSGTLTYVAGSVMISSVAPFGGYDTRIAGNSLGDMTMLVIAKKELVGSTSFPPFLSSAAPFTGFHNYIGAGTGARLYNSTSGVEANVADIAMPAPHSFYLWAGRMPLGGKATLSYYEASVRTDNIAESNGGARPATNLIMGTQLPTVQAAKASMAYAAIFNRILSTAELDSVYASLKAFMLTRSVTVA